MIYPLDPLKRTVISKVNPRFRKMNVHITLPKFKGEEPNIKFEYKLILKEILTSPSIKSNLKWIYILILIKYKMI